VGNSLHNDLPLIQQYGPELEKHCRPYLRLTHDSWRVDETYIEVKGEWKYLYWAVDSNGNTLDFLLTVKQNTEAAKRFFRKVLRANHTQAPRVINVDTVDQGVGSPDPNNLKNAAYPQAIDELKAKKELSEKVELRLNKYLNNRVEQNQQFIKWLVKPEMGFGLFNTVRRTIRGYEIMNMIPKGQIEKVEKAAVKQQVKFMAEILGVTA
jgi:transposase-like protein